jgi:uncharacterized membrane protein
VHVIRWVVFVAFAVGIGAYPVTYILLGSSHGVLVGRDIYGEPVWRWLFYQHLTFGGLAMLAGVSQFSRRLRTRNPGLHRTLGKVYILSVLASGIAGVYLAVHTMGGPPARVGFFLLGSAWLLATGLAYARIRGGLVRAHERWMIRSYALTWAAVTLRLYLPLFEAAFGMGFDRSYPIIAWLCWVPNLLVAEWIVRRRRTGPALATARVRPTMGRDVAPH